MIQKYICDKCSTEGSVFYQGNDDIMTVVNRIEDDHKIRSPGCENPVNNIRVKNRGDIEYSDLHFRAYLELCLAIYTEAVVTNSMGKFVDKFSKFLREIKEV